MQIAIIVAHPDDEALGCGGTIAKHTVNGDTVNLLTLADGVGSRLNSNNSDLKLRNSALIKSSQVLGISHVESADFPDNQFDSVPLLTITQAIESFLQRFPAERIYTHFANDLNIDHQKTHAAVLTACRPQPEQNVKQIFCFETLSSTEWASHQYPAFRPNYFVDISISMKNKMQALEAYHEEMRPAPHTRSFDNVQALAQYRGMSIGLKFAESFYIERYIEA
ncbi:hypothetical protein CJF42_22515 [Pseudoalteromonas sp. NBT06-2]|uniref:PIG-L deacetylase family protein n=1 Tax=Pseudoalteromonas sp. NBT06-2 TaxID=2025950 RepID=UPI000BA51276|nr:PIG-L deacetylase family protein [Pseudoalteromonas sp. NBT06-2]PAJ72197.1 hypothetical protein CJF42_22515 [Pseudoalteromonas sp. NBT06-2]